MTDVTSQNQTIPQYDENHYAVVDLGSNSFHLLIVKLDSSRNTVSPVNKVKEKVRLAAGLNSDNELSNEAISRGLSCLSLFAQHLNSIPVNNVLIVATAALRIATNNQTFFDAAKKILPKEINLLSGEQEAQTIYAGVAHTARCQTELAKSKQLVIDIGGASTEVVVGKGCIANKVTSLHMGCVSYLKRYFADNTLSADNFSHAIAGAIETTSGIKEDYLALGWDNAVSSSGTMQALVEILTERKQEKIITPDFLEQIKSELIQCDTIDDIAIKGLRADRAAVLASGLAILIGLFQSLSIKQLCLSSGALREGLLFKLLPNAKIC